MKFALAFIFLSSNTVQAKDLSLQIYDSLKSYCRGIKGNSSLDKKIQSLSPSRKRCGLFELRSYEVKQFRLPISAVKSNQRIDLHLPQLKVIEEEDDFFNDDLYMWFVITLDGISYTKVTKIYKGLDEGQVLQFDHEDRVINSIAFRRNAIIDWGIVESDGDDIAEMQRLSRNALDLIFMALSEQEDPDTPNRIERLREQTAKVMTLLLGLDHDDRLATGSLVLDSSDSQRTWENGGIMEFKQDFRGSHFGSDWHYELLWRLILVDNSPSKLF
mgnify:CR=1 FL=1